MAPPTIIAHKSAFLTTQTLHLSQSLTPSTAWREANDAADDGLPARAVDDALYRLNHALSQHARRVYAPQASRHVAEQIEGLFHEVRASARDEDEDGDEVQLRQGTDFTTADAIASLPNTWSAPEHPLEAQRYASLAENLKALSSKRQELLARVTRLRRIAAMLAPFSSRGNNQEGEEREEGRDLASVQENLVTRNGELERELERMRLLLARVAGRVAQLPDARAEGDSAGVDLDSFERGKVERLLDTL